MLRQSLSITCLVILLLGISTNVQSAAKTINFTQVPCQFLEPEVKNFQFNASSSSECENINDSTEKSRLAQSKVITLSPGKYRILVTNKSVPYTLGFWLRGAGLSRAFLPSVSGGGIEPGMTQEYDITLVEGEYFYSCPLNPTPNYRLVVK